MSAVYNLVKEQLTVPLLEVTEVDEDGKETTRTEKVTETILEISLTHKTAEEMAQQLLIIF